MHGTVVYLQYGIV